MFLFPLIVFLEDLSTPLTSILIELSDEISLFFIVTSEGILFELNFSIKIGIPVPVSIVFPVIVNPDASSF